MVNIFMTGLWIFSILFLRSCLLLLTARIRWMNYTHVFEQRSQWMNAAKVVLPTGMPVPAFARPLAKNPMPAMPVARKFSTGKCPQCPLPECEKRACPRAKTGIKFSRKCDDFPLKNRKKCLFSLHEIATYIFWLFSSKFRNFWLFSAKIMNF